MSKGSVIRKLREELGISQTDFAKLIHVSKQTLYKYENDIVTNIPSDKVELIARFLHVEPSVIMGWSEDTSDSDSKGYYINQETAQVAQKIMENKELGLLFSAASDASPEDLLTVHQMLLALKRKEQSD